jgi:putative hydrolase of the HAD superfamily
MLEGLKRSGLLVGLVTNGQHALQYAKLAHTGLEYVFDEIVVSGDVGVEKPDREIFDLACEKLGLDPREAVYVGDNRRNDIDGAAGAGMRTVWLKSTNPGQSGRYEPDAVIADLRELPETLKKLGVKIRAEI